MSTAVVAGVTFYLLVVAAGTFFSGWAWCYEFHVIRNISRVYNDGYKQGREHGYQLEKLGALYQELNKHD
jgi:hypothetical protein